ncbi:hypothetical protein LTR08_008361 [Meristemomyces frigidus]|nr:hypothetical protein LTR08_008361 [Meristemomyces frigidus]
MDASTRPSNPLHDFTSSQAITLITAVATLATVLPLLLHLYHDYLAFLSLGPGGTPATITGFIRVKALSLACLRDPYQAPPIPERFKGSQGYLVDFPVRHAPRPVTRGIAPHRQVTQRASKPIYDKLAQAIERMGHEHADDLEIGTSCFEKHGTGLFSRAPAKRTCQGEICHAHASDGSMHMTLHPADAKTVLEAGWAERHPIARGGWFERFVPGGFVMVYAPREEREVEVVMRVVEAAAWFVRGGDGIVEGERRDSGIVPAEGDER